MTISDLIYDVNNLELSKLVPMNSIKTTEDADLYREKGYYIPITYIEFIKKHSKISTELDVNNFYYMSNSLSASLYYYDKEKFIFIDFIYSRDIGFFMPNDDADNEVIHCVKLFEKLFEKKDFISLLMRPPSSVKLTLLKGIVEKYDESFVYDLFLAWYTDSDYGFSVISPEMVKKIISLKSDEEKSITAEKIKDFPETIIVYRGEADKSTIYHNAYSWSTDINVAKFFALRHNDGTSAKIYKAKINKNDIIEYIDDRNESEILILPEHVSIEDCIDMYSLDDVSDILTEYLDLAIFFKHKLINTLKFKHDSEYHGKLHTARVLFNAAVLASTEGLNYEEAATLFTACIYHDIGRNHDDDCIHHGAKSSEIFRTNGNYDPVIEFLIKYHCIDDDIALKELESNNLIVDKSSVKLLFNILKDCDALDRFRFGLKDLDVNMLRLESSKKLMLFAYKSIDAIKL